tara:strand:+ start:59217 stop:60551 length:1335 start_codon:yes stop_codon:yes gene_type:complete
MFAIAFFVVAGCAREEKPVVFEPNLVHALKYQIKEDIPTDQALQDANWITHRLFGTPDEPTLPEMVIEDEDFASLINMERLKRAAGPDGEGRGLYRKHCALCHGVTGNGRGETAAVLRPYPRDYRMGIFKFKSTKRGSKPTREDIAKQIRNGIPGTAMVKIKELGEQDVQALTDYVIYLSIRGELERSLIDDAVFELDLEGGDRILDTEFATTMDKETIEFLEDKIEAWEDAGEKEEDQPAELDDFELYQESWEIVEDIVAGLFEDWLDAEDDVVEVPEPAADIPVADSRAEFVELSQGDQADALAASVKRGQEVFVGKIAACSKCHGEKGLGNGQTTDYDDWTKDWTSRVGLKPEDYDSLVPLIARGALPPVNAIPRNFAEGIFHGGSTAADLYRRITVGIEGSPMPAATFVEGQFEEADVWHIINFIRSLQNEDAPVAVDAT